MTWPILLRRVLLARPGRSVLAAVSIGLGVAVYVGVSIGSANLSASLNGSSLPGQEHLVTFRPAGVGEATVAASAADALLVLPGVQHAFGTLQSSILVRSDAADSSPISLEVAGTTEPSATDGLLLPASRARSLGVAEGDVVVVQTSLGEHRVAVDGTYDDGQSGALSFATTSLDALGQWTGQTGRISFGIAVLDPAVDRVDWIAEHRDDIPGLLSAEDDLFSTSDAEEFFRSLEDTISPLAGAALVVASYLIYLTLSRTVAEQSQMYATMRTVGASRGQVAAVVLSEAAVLSIAGTVVGLASGVAAGSVVAEVMREIFGLSVGTAHIVPLHILLTGAALGILAPIAAAAVPAYRALIAEPAESLHLVTRHRIVRPGLRRTVVASAVCVLAIIGVAAFGGEPQGIATVVALGAAAVALPGLLVPVARTLVRPIARALPGPGELAAQDLSRRPGHAAATSALLAVTLGVAVLVGTIIESTRPGIRSILDAHYSTDYRIESTGREPFSSEQSAALGSLPQVDAITPYTVGRTRVLTNDSGAQYVVVIDPETYFEVAALAWTPETDPAEAEGLLRAGGHVALERRIAESAGLITGAKVALETPDGTATFRVAGTYYGLAFGETNAVVISARDAGAHLGYVGPREFFVSTSAGATLDLADLADLGTPVFLDDTREIYEAIYAQLDGLFGLIIMILVITAGVGIFGLANTLVIDTIDRRHELDVLETLGAGRRDIRTFITGRSLLLTTTASVGAVVLGGALGAATISGAATTNGIPTSYTFPVGTAITVVVLAAVVGVLSSVQPTRVVRSELALD